MNKSLLAVAVASLCSYTSFSYAQEATADETVVVTANRFETKVNETIAPVEVITREEIDAIQAQSLTDVLRRLPSIQVVNHLLEIELESLGLKLSLGKRSMRFTLSL